MNYKHNIAVLLLILLFFLVTRLYKIGEIPPSVYWDEASIGYNAYSIIQTGKDEWGKLFPIDFEAFGEYKLPVYIYTTALFAKILGLNEFAVRVPAVMFSLGVIISSFSLARKLTKDNTAALLTAFFITTSQWFFIISKTGFEATAGLFFFTLGVYLFLLSLKNRAIFLVISSISFILSMYSYNSFIIITPLTLLILALLYYTRLKFYLRENLILSIICLIVFVLGGWGISKLILSGHTARLDEVGISGAYNYRKYQTIFTATKNYFSHFNPTFLFFMGDGNNRSQQPNFGQMNLVYLPLLILGFLYILQKKEKEYFLILSLLMIAPIPASITRESPHALRSISAVPFIAFILSLGVLKLVSFFNNKGLYFKLIICLVTIIFLSYYQVFIVSYAKKTANDWQYGYKKFFDEYKSKFSEFDHILISDRYNQPYIFALFYLQYDPAKFRSQVKYNTSIRRKTSLVQSFDKFIFTNIDYYQIPKGKNLIFTHPTDKMDEIKWEKIIVNPDGSIGGYVYAYEK